MREEHGSAVVEFLALSVLLMIPVVWFLLAIGQVQAATYAATGAADQGAKVHTTSTVSPEVAAEQAVTRTLSDYGVSAEHATVTRQCTPDCTSSGSVVSITVEVHVPLPGLPRISGVDLTLVNVSATASDVVRQEVP
ncbi:hypothetical protein [Nesterenkonia alba]|uniref:hypothetical protein n=1 Tax=Nesterenkonia alba TaxID=515814 RepID=UPI0012EB3959|nr:hypothetical protein [Nesterenkonia alba]